MTMRYQHTLLALALFGAAQAQAVTFEGSVTQGATVVADYAANGLISFDIDFASFAPATVTYRIDDGDLAAGTVSLNAILRNLVAGVGFDAYTVALGSGSFASAGSVTRQFGGSTQLSVAPQLATIGFTPAEYLDIELGNALGTTPGAQDWLLGGLAVGDRISLTVTPVPEPGAVALMLAGLGVIGFVARRRKP